MPMAMAALFHADGFETILMMSSWAIGFGFGAMLVYICHQACLTIALRARSDQANRDGIQFGAFTDHQKFAANLIANPRRQKLRSGETP